VAGTVVSAAAAGTTLETAGEAPAMLDAASRAVARTGTKRILSVDLVSPH
jgi:hypothetical protein